MNGVELANPPLRAVAAALGGLIARHSSDDISRTLMHDFELDLHEAERCIELARRARRRSAD